MKLTRFNHCADPSGSPRELTFDGFVDLFGHPHAVDSPEASRTWAPIEYVGNYRKAKNAKLIHALVLDVSNERQDGSQHTPPVGPEGALAVFPGVNAGWYASKRFTTFLPRFFLIMELSRPVTPEEYYRLVRWARGELHKASGYLPLSKDHNLARQYLVPVGRPGYRHEKRGGAPIDVESILSTTPAEMIQLHNITNKGLLRDLIESQTFLRGPSCIYWQWGSTLIQVGSKDYYSKIAALMIHKHGIHVGRHAINTGTTPILGFPRSLARTTAPEGWVHQSKDEPIGGIAFLDCGNGALEYSGDGVQWHEVSPIPFVRPFCPVAIEPDTEEVYDPRSVLESWRLRLGMDRGGWTPAVSWLLWAMWRIGPAPPIPVRLESTLRSIVSPIASKFEDRGELVEALAMAISEVLPRFDTGQVPTGMEVASAAAHPCGLRPSEVCGAWVGLDPFLIALLALVSQGWKGKPSELRSSLITNGLAQPWLPTQRALRKALGALGPELQRRGIRFTISNRDQARPIYRFERIKHTIQPTVSEPNRCWDEN